MNVARLQDLDRWLRSGHFKPRATLRRPATPLKHSKTAPTVARHKTGRVVCGLQSCAGSCDVGIT